MMGGKHMDGHNKEKMEKMWFQNEDFFCFVFSHGKHTCRCAALFSMIYCLWNVKILFW